MTPQERLQRLVAKWRTDSHAMYPRRSEWREMDPATRYDLEGRCEQLDICADELDAEIAAMAQDGAGEWPDYVTTQDFVVCRVMPTETGWDLRLGPDVDDPWVSLPQDFPTEPKRGQIATVIVPRVVALAAAGNQENERDH